MTDPNAWRALVPRRTDRALFVGMTGSGKTTLAQRLLDHRKHVVCYDGKGTLNWPGYKLVTDLSRLYREKSPRMVYRPSVAAMQDEDAKEEFFAWLYARGNTTLYVDEAYTLGAGDDMPFSLRAILTRGREHGLESWTATQRPMRIPQEMISEAEHVYCFKLRMEQDRKKLAQVAGVDPDTIRVDVKRDFLYFREDSAAPFGPFRLALTPTNGTATR